MRHEASYLKDILLAARRIEAIVTTKSREEFFRNDESQAAVLHHLTITGEAANRLSPGLCERHSEVPWAQIVAARNRIVHEYFGLDWQLLWGTAVDDVPLLRRQIAAILQEEFGEPAPDFG
jgi:uncharacterized protein with HEPN domain